MNLLKPNIILIFFLITVVSTTIVLFLVKTNGSSSHAATYVALYGVHDGKITVIDLKTDEKWIINIDNVGIVEDLCQSAGGILIACSVGRSIITGRGGSGSGLYELDINSGAIENKGGAALSGPVKYVADDDGTLWILCHGRLLKSKNMVEFECVADNVISVVPWSFKKCLVQLMDRQLLVLDKTTSELVALPIKDFTSGGTVTGVFLNYILFSGGETIIVDQLILAKLGVTLQGWNGPMLRKFGISPHCVFTQPDGLGAFASWNQEFPLNQLSVRWGKDGGSTSRYRGVKAFKGRFISASLAGQLITLADKHK